MSEVEPNDEESVPDDPRQHEEEDRHVSSSEDESVLQTLESMPASSDAVTGEGIASIIGAEESLTESVAGDEGNAVTSPEVIEPADEDINQIPVP